MTCEYKNMFGKAREGVHSYRFLNIAVVDTIATIIIAYLIHAFTKVNFFLVLLLLFLLGIISHRLFCVRTTIDKLLFKE